MTQQQLAVALGVHWMTVSKLERGKMQLTLGWLERIASALNLRPLELVIADTTTLEVWVEGQIVNGMTVEIDPAGPKVAAVSRAVDDLLGRWLRIRGSDFEPFFFDGDFIKVTQSHLQGFEDQHVGRLAYVAFEDQNGTTLSAFVIVDRHLEGDLFNLRSIKGIRFDRAKVIAIETLQAMQVHTPEMA